ncbi:MAG: thioredoxin family protein [Polyangiaceae bacterium]
MTRVRTLARLGAVLLGVLSVAACSRRPPGPGAAQRAIRFIDDDYPRALADARARGVPLFVDAWATWCHSCLSMRTFVFGDPRLAPLAGRYAWLSLDTEREGNAAVVTRLGVKVLPTLYVIAPSDERVLLAWPGSLTAPELATLLDDTRKGDGPRGPLRIDAEVTHASREERVSDCAAMAAREAPAMPEGTAVADVVRTGIECAEKLPSAAGRSSLESLAALGERIAADASQPVLADDRSDLYDHVVGAYGALDRPADASRVARVWSAFLEEQAAAAATPSARAVFDSHRLRAFTVVGEPGRAIPMLEQSRRDFPGDYNPPARLAATYLAMKRYADALAAVDQALGLAYGPRKLRLWSLEAEILAAEGNATAAAEALREGLVFAGTVALPESYPKQVEAMRRQLAALSAGDAGPDAH